MNFSEDFLKKLSLQKADELKKEAAKAEAAANIAVQKEIDAQMYNLFADAPSSPEPTQAPVPVPSRTRRRKSILIPGEPIETAESVAPGLFAPIDCESCAAMKQLVLNLQETVVGLRATVKEKEQLNSHFVVILKEISEHVGKGVAYHDSIVENFNAFSGIFQSLKNALPELLANVKKLEAPKSTPITPPKPPANLTKDEMIKLLIGK